MMHLIIGRDTDGRDDYCVTCGRPFDRGDTAVASDEDGELTCSRRCLEWLLDRNRQQRRATRTLTLNRG
jgi:predicted nucleic acid-binding Zn ribbon protein